MDLLTSWNTILLGLVEIFMAVVDIVFFVMWRLWRFRTALICFAQNGFIDIYLVGLLFPDISKMAFCTKLGGQLKQGVFQNRNVPVTSMLGSLRYMSTKIYIGGKHKFLSDGFRFITICSFECFVTLHLLSLV